MQSSENVLYNLSKKANEKDYTFKRIYRNLYNPNFYYHAYENILVRKGLGANGVPVVGFGEEQITSIIESLKDESYQPQPIKNSSPRNKDNKQPSITDRIVEEICRMLLDAIYEPYFLEASHAFRPKKSCHTALLQVKQAFNGASWFIEGNIKGFYQNINHHILINLLRKRICDEKFLRLMWKFLKAGYTENWTFNQTYSGTPHGGRISPILANIYLNEFDLYMMDKLKREFDVDNSNSREEIMENKINDMRNRENNAAMNPKCPYPGEGSKGYKSFSYVRYADQFIVGVQGNKADCKLLEDKMRDFLKEKLNLHLTEQKKLITNSNKPVNFLGYSIKVMKGINHTNRVNQCKIRLSIPDGTIEKVITKHKMVKDISEKNWKILHRPELIKYTPKAIVETYNAELRSLYSYYRLANNVSAKMSQLRYVMEYSCLKTLAGKYRTSIRKIKEKYRDGQRWGVPYETRQGEKIVYFFHEPLSMKNHASILEVDNLPYSLKRIDKM
ncbi:reverse transcriptase/maturase family protein [Metabacillus malikii]|uniref:Group II intron reverse transcriptase/maturase n=1 Tax=Metabacillus malikii TaxID=1504265 RepID=A0ABT9ZD97_9BACI|nr:reverse transcriptase/maturase family protein [Metabacillus malikii]MDQ0230229.1 group II intron reverse transcriptase/maturase [Metabacillus malikii]